MQDDYIIKTQKTWDTIAESFDKTRRYPWNQCIDFINSFHVLPLVARVFAPRV